MVWPQLGAAQELRLLWDRTPTRRTVSFTDRQPQTELVPPVPRKARMDLVKGAGCLVLLVAISRFAWRQHRSTLPPLGLYHPLPMPFMTFGTLAPLSAAFFLSYVEGIAPLRYGLYAVMVLGLFVGLFGLALHGMLIFGWFPKPDSWMYPGYGTQEIVKPRHRGQRDGQQARSVRAQRLRGGRR
jgi:hypothetical protein